MGWAQISHFTAVLEVQRLTMISAWLHLVGAVARNWIAYELEH